jgi:hypothetical protein
MTPIWVSMACYRDSFTFTFIFSGTLSSWYKLKFYGDYSNKLEKQLFSYVQLNFSYMHICIHVDVLIQVAENVA